jgi:anti-anti-sigma regulatory factor
MQVKIDTKERFHVIVLEEPILSANIAAELTQLTSAYLESKVKNVVLKLPSTTFVEEVGAEELVRLQQNFYENNASFVICELQAEIEDKLDELELLEIMNVTKTESEAWDIVQMEEIERELMDDADIDFNKQGE